MDIADTLEHVPYRMSDVPSLGEYLQVTFDLNDATEDGSRAYADYLIDGFFGPPSTLAGLVLAGAGMVTALSSGPDIPADWASAIYPASLVVAGVALYRFGARRLRSQKEHREELAENLPVLFDAVERADRLGLPVPERARSLLDPGTVFSWWHD